MTWQLLLMDANAIVCLLIMVRLMFFRKEGKRHRLSVAVLAYLVILAAGFNAFNILLGHYVQVIREDMADYMLSGDAKVKVKGYVGAGITNHANTNQVDLSASGLNIDLTTSTPDESVAFFTGPFAKLLDDNYVQEKVKLWASPDIMRNLNRPYSDAAGFKEGTVLEYILRYGRIESFNQTFKLTGNHFIAYVRNSQYIKTRIAAPVGTFMIPRQNPFDNYNTLVWSAVGLQIKRDFNGRSKVFNAQG